jgi:hypothetical protein
MSMNHGREIHEEDDPELWHIVEDMALAGQVPMPRVFIIDDPARMLLRLDEILSIATLPLQLAYEND